SAGPPRARAGPRPARGPPAPPAGDRGSARRGAAASAPGTRAARAGGRPRAAAGPRAPRALPAATRTWGASVADGSRRAAGSVRTPRVGLRLRHLAVRRQGQQQLEVELRVVVLGVGARGLRERVQAGLDVLAGAGGIAAGVLELEHAEEVLGA